MKNKLIGRENEQSVLQKALQSDEAEMLALLGRRRVGKTFLVRTVYAQQLRFEITGLQNANLKTQISNFSLHLKAAFGDNAPSAKPENWLEAFYQLTECLDKQIAAKTFADEKFVVFFDELPWLATPKSGFLDALSFFWNSWATKRKIVVVICGSAASWMIQNVVNHKGGLHNRITRRIHLLPFNLYETDVFLRSRNVVLDHYQIAQIYMAIGGIPHYLKEIECGKSAAQNIEQICFSSTGSLNDEFMRLYPALFDDATQHIAIIRTLAQKWKGLTRQEIIAATHLTDGGSLTNCLEELEYSGFITVYPAFGKKSKDFLFRLTDEYSLFYLQFMQKSKQTHRNTWQQFSQTQEFKTWSGYAFENLCLKHSEQIKKALGISGIYTETSSFYYKGSDTQSGTQIDLIMDRKDSVIDLFELKFYNELFTVSKKYAAELREKIAMFKAISKTQKQVFIHILSVFGLKPNENSLSVVNSGLSIDILFEKN